jgi:outer membrane protein OmpA-like peptidoglycan-associated protein
MALLLVSGRAHGLDLALPENAAIFAATPPAQGTHTIATGPWDGARVPVDDISGTVRAAVWQVPASDAVTIATVASGIESQLLAQGYRIDLSCADRACGGFDFRRRLDMGRSPEMHVDIGNFRYLAASVPNQPDTVAATVSRGGDTIYVHVVHVGDTANEPSWVTPSTRAPLSVEDVEDRPGTGGDTPAPVAIARLAELGAVPLDDLRFRTGSSDLSGDSSPSLLALAAFLAENPDRRVVLVGHTDAEGGRDSNIALSEARAEAVRNHLIDVLGANPAQLDAAGIGYLAPRATNETANGREANRRVEVVLLSDG